MTLAFLAPLVVSRAAGAQARWMPLPPSPDARLAWRRDSAEDGHPTVWLRTTYRTLQVAGALHFDRTEQQFAVDCRRRRVLWLVTPYYRRGDAVDRDHLEPGMGEPWEDAVKRTGLRRFLPTVCPR